MWAHVNFLNLFNDDPNDTGIPSADSTTSPRKRFVFVAEEENSHEYIADHDHVVIKQSVREQTKAAMKAETEEFSVQVRSANAKEALTAPSPVEPLGEDTEPIVPSEHSFNAIPEEHTSPGEMTRRIDERLAVLPWTRAEFFTGRALWFRNPNRPALEF